MSTPPTVPHVHDSDRKAAEEIRMRLGFMAPPTNDWITKCIALHHAEERAAVEKVRGVLNELERLLTTYSRLDSKCSFCMIPQHYADAALTALRTASQSPTERKT